ncbi:hypothetical protein [Limibacterium fermenti]|uniref:hypothetical protein n=1 Tax=Limibacterium fermenti TaxID=3229863 RepID=UPI000E938CE5|nr:hypothetical protein [Porphyromonadaceae bacterium]HBK32439.1 hypothetical protein [Porphyromonadaceae bacterium]HBX21207.1 hypothetical protein [Porphyromonadaceae bacterium]
MSLFKRNKKSSAPEVENASTAPLQEEPQNAGLNAEVAAVIAAALYELDQDVHDVESGVLTIEYAQHDYSPWSSKIQTLRQLPDKR